MSNVFLTTVFGDLRTSVRRALRRWGRPWKIHNFTIRSIGFREFVVVQEIDIGYYFSLACSHVNNESVKFILDKDFGTPFHCRFPSIRLKSVVCRYEDAEDVRSGIKLLRDALRSALYLETI